ncbi:helix-turn-helix domain-containing protein [Moraxella catarrhalis]|uniref:helix-turn-helix domain-containing protein n=1 Tax=Moraxella catarrhalis TaxID=480 RepID=UPI00128C4E27|nr:helix-turn-helix transcriptional regulator [Moraxella catarrhalis]MPY07388.1 XRE family transcriptional regulator [Moraxella catarrhalis]
MKDRIREERERLGFTQAQFAGIGKVTPRSQQNYETTDRKPDADYLAEIAKIGADILYIVTGQRSQNTVSETGSKLLSSFHSATASVQSFVLQGLGIQSDTPKEKPTHTTFQNTCNGSVGSQMQAQGDINLNQTPNHGYINQGKHKGDVSFGQ